MTKHDEMKVFLESIRTSENSAMIDAVVEGYDACMESINWGNLAWLSSVPLAVAGAGAYGMHASGHHLIDHGMDTSSASVVPADKMPQAPKTVETKADTKKSVGKTEQKPVMSTKNTEVTQDKDGFVVNLKKGASNLASSLSSSAGKLFDNGPVDQADMETKFHQTEKNEVEHIEDRLDEATDMFEDAGWRRIPFGDYFNAHGKVGHSDGYSFKHNRLVKCAKAMDIDISDADAWMVDPSGYVVYNMFTNEAMLTVAPGTLEKYIDGKYPDDRNFYTGDVADKDLHVIGMGYKTALIMSKNLQGKLRPEMRTANRTSFNNKAYQKLPERHVL